MFPQRGCLLQNVAKASLVLLSVSWLNATAITGDDETVESTPTPVQSTLRPSSTPAEEAPVLTPETNSLPAAVTPQPSPTPPKVDPFVVLMRKANADFKKRDFAHALTQIDAAEVFRADSAEAINFRGAIYSEMGDYEKAAEFYHKALELQPTSFWPAYNLSELEFMQGHYAKARQGFADMLQKTPSNELLQFKVMLTYLEEKNDKAAKAEIEKIAFPSKTAAYYFAWAAWEFRHGNPAAATEWLNSGETIFGKARTQFLYTSLADLKMVPLPRP